MSSFLILQSKSWLLLGSQEQWLQRVFSWESHELVSHVGGGKPLRARCESVNFARRGWVFWVRMLQSAIYSKIDFLTVTLCRRGSQGCQAFHHSTQVANKSWTFAATGISAVMSSDVSVVISRGCQFLAGDCSNHFFGWPMLCADAIKYF
jgi:hypothetical protein